MVRPGEVRLLQFRIPQLGLLQLQQVPQIPIQIFKNGHGAIRFDFRFPREGYTQGNHLMVITPEVVGMEEKKDSAAGLLADESFLLSIRSAGQQQRRTGSSGRSYHHPAFILFRLIRIFNDGEVELSGVKLDRFVVVANDQGNMDNRLFHGYADGILPTGPIVLP